MKIFLTVLLTIFSIFIFLILSVGIYIIKKIKIALPIKTYSNAKVITIIQYGQPQEGKVVDTSQYESKKIIVITVNLLVTREEMNNRAFERAKEAAQQEALEYGLDIDEEEIDELCKAAVEECLDYQINENATVEIYKDGTCLVYGGE